VVARYTHGPGIDEPLIMLRGGQSFFYHIDALGSVWDVTDSAGTGVRSYSYDSFGQLLTQTGTLSNPYTYTARELDPETGLYYYRARYYEPVVGRFLQEDPSGFFGGINFYTYAQNDPLNFFDPWGLAGEDEWVFHERHHGGPHLQRGQDRYRYNPETRQLEPIPHKGRTPPHLSKSQLRKLMKTPAFKRMLRRLGLVGAAIAAIEIFEAATADKSEAFENLLEIIGDFPEDKRQMILEEVCKKNPDVCSAHFDEPLEEPECR
ncbi:MAG: RHS repeat domain-containing protein, partial [Candidatus Binatia bacterium]